MSEKQQSLNGLFIDTIKEQKVPMFRLAFSIVMNREDAEDVVSETVYKAYSHLSELRNPKRIKSWIFQILVNESKTCIKKRSRLELVEDTSLFLEEDGNKESSYDLLEFVYQLGDNFKEVIILYYFEEFRVKEIAKILNISEGTVKSRLSRARVELKRFIENSNQKG